MSHIRTDTDESKSWCGETLGMEFFFKNAEMAAINGMHESKPVCNKCIDIIIHCLEKGRKDEV
jgi:hypothetical protein